MLSTCLSQGLHPFSLPCPLGTVTFHTHYLHCTFFKQNRKLITAVFTVMPFPKLLSPPTSFPTMQWIANTVHHKHLMEQIPISLLKHQYQKGKWIISYGKSRFDNPPKGMGGKRVLIFAQFSYQFFVFFSSNHYLQTFLKMGVRRKARRFWR